MSLMNIEPAQRGAKRLIVRVFLEAVFGGLGVFLLAAVLAPRLFDMHNNLALLGAIVVWIACPVLLFLLVADIAERLKARRPYP